MSLPKSKYEPEYDFRSNVSIVQLARMLYLPTGPQFSKFLKKYKLSTIQQAQDLLCKKIIDAASTQEYKDLLGYYSTERKDFIGWIEEGILGGDYVECIVGEDKKRDKDKYLETLSIMFDGECKSEIQSNDTQLTSDIEEDKKKKDPTYLTHQDLQENIKENWKSVEKSQLPQMTKKRKK